MSEETPLVVDATLNTDAVDTTAEIAKLKAINLDLIKTRDEAKDKLRKIDEDISRQKDADLVEKEKYKELYENTVDKYSKLAERFDNNALDSAINMALTDAKISATSTASKLVDRSKLSIDESGAISGMQTVMDDLKTNHPILFVPDTKVPDIKPVDESTPPKDLDITKLNMRDPADRAIYAKYRKSQGFS